MFKRFFTKLFRPDVVYINPELTIASVVHGARHVEDDIRYKQDYLKFIKGNHPMNLTKMIQQAAQTGYSMESCSEGSGCWIEDPMMQLVFVRTLKVTGFNASFGVSDSGGPEANTVFVTISMIGYSPAEQGPDE